MRLLNDGSTSNVTTCSCLHGLGGACLVTALIHAKFFIVRVSVGCDDRQSLVIFRTGAFTTIPYVSSGKMKNVVWD